MELTEAYIFLFADSFMSALALPFKTSLVFAAMKIFGGYNTYIMLFMAIIGAVTGGMVNWFVGRFIMIASKYKPEVPRALQFIEFCRKYGCWLLFLCWIPVFGPVLIVAMGAVGAKLKTLLPFIFIANILYYSVVLLT